MNKQDLEHTERALQKTIKRNYKPPRMENIFEFIICVLFIIFQPANLFIVGVIILVLSIT